MKKTFVSGMIIASQILAGSALAWAKDKTERQPAQSSSCTTTDVKQSACEIAGSDDSIWKCVHRSAYVEAQYTPGQIRNDCAADACQDIRVIQQGSQKYLASIGGTTLHLTCVVSGSTAQRDSGCTCTQN